jgi:hypothetical protein
LTYVRDSRSKRAYYELINSELAYKSSTNVYADPKANTVNNGATWKSASVITTRRSVIVVVAVIVTAIGNGWEIKRGGVTKTLETTTDFNATTATIVLYALETLEAGTYQYDVVNGTGGNKEALSVGIKIVAIAEA